MLCTLSTIGATPPAALRLSFAFTTSLRTLIVPAATSLGEDASILNFAVETFQRDLKRITGIHFDLTHVDYQRDLRSLVRPELCGW